MTLAEIDHAVQLPTGWYDDQDAGHYRTRQVPDDKSWFLYTVSSQPWKRYLQPAADLFRRALV